jgi:nucleoside-diphosphate-sugar epimerase
MAGALLSLGHGYSAAALAARLVPRGWRVAGTSRDPGRRAEMEAAGVAPLAWPLADPAAALDGADHLLVSVGPDALGDPVLRAMGDAIAARAGAFRWVGYLSTTGVYGDRGGDWVDEGSALLAGTARGRARVAAEAAWLDLWRDRGLPVHLFRLAGIYGPGRGPFEKVRDGAARRIVKPGQVFSRIHVDDIAQALDASIARPNPGAAYNVCDDDPAPPEDVLAHAAALLGLPPPPAVPYDEAAPGMTDMARSFYAESKRVSNRRMKEELGVRLRWPTYREGLAGMLADAG